MPNAIEKRCVVIRPPMTRAQGDLGVLDLENWPRVPVQEMIKWIRTTPAYGRLSESARQTVERGITRAQQKPYPGFYLQRLFTLITTPERPHLNRRLKQQALLQLNADVDLAVRTRARCDEDKEERAVRSPERSWEPILGLNDKTYEVDARDPNHVFIRIRVQVTGPQADKVRLLDNLIEKTLGQATGFTVDLQFVDHPGPDVFSVGSDPAKWPSSENWSAGAFGAAHELMHLMNVDDAYDFAGRHAGNPLVSLEDRLELFLYGLEFDYNRIQDALSLMGHGSRPTNADVCRAAGRDEECVAQRAMNKPTAKGASLRPQGGG